MHKIKQDYLSFEVTASSTSDPEATAPGRWAPAAIGEKDSDSHVPCALIGGHIHGLSSF